MKHVLVGLILIAIITAAVCSILTALLWLSLKFFGAAHMLEGFAGLLFLPVLLVASYGMGRIVLGN